MMVTNALVFLTTERARSQVCGLRKLDTTQSKEGCLYILALS